MRQIFPAFGMVVALTAPAVAQSQVGISAGISVNGEGEVTVPADMATVTLGVRNESETTGEAIDAVAIATAGIMAVLEAAAIPPADIQTGRVNMSPRYAQTMLGATDYSQIEGYTASSTISVDVHDLTGLGGLISDMVAGGANTVNGVTFGLDDPSALMDDARMAAVADARHRAEVYAEAAGVSLGDVLYISEDSFGDYMPVMSPMAESRMTLSSAPQYDIPLSPGDITVRANVSILFGIASD